MSSPWPSQALAEVCEIKPPKREAKRKLKDTDSVSFLPMEDLGIDQKFIGPKAERRLGQVAGSYTYFADGDVLLAKITPCFENGKLGIAKNLTNGIGFGSSEHMVFRPRADLSNGYLYYFLLQDSFRAEGIKSMSGAVGHKRVSKEFVERCQIPLPTLSEQERIVAILDGAFAGLATATSNAEKNLKNARELFDNYLHSLFEQAGEDWAEKTFAESATVESGAGFRKKHQGKTDQRYPFYKVSDMNLPGNEVRLMVHNNSASEKVRTELGAKVFPKGSIIFPKIGAAIATNKKRLVETPCCVDNNVMGIIPHQDALDSEFLYFLLQSMDISDFANDSELPSIRKTTVEAWKFSSPKRIGDQKKVAAKLWEILEQTRALEGYYQTKVSAVFELKQSILQKAFAGELTSPSSQVIREAAE